MSLFSSIGRRRRAGTSGLKAASSLPSDSRSPAPAASVATSGGEPEEDPVAPQLDDTAPDDLLPGEKANSANPTGAAPPEPGVGNGAQSLPARLLDLPDFCADELLLQRAHRRLVERWRWHDTPAERRRLARDYARLCPDLESPWFWYLVRPVVFAGWRSAWPALLPPLLAGPLLVELFPMATGRPTPLLLPLILGLVLARPLHVGEFLTSLGRARRCGLLQAMILSGRRVPQFADELSRSADFLVRDVWFAATLAGAATIAVRQSLTPFDLLLLGIVLVVQLVRVAARVRQRGRIREAIETLAGADAAPEQRAGAFAQLEVLRREGGEDVSNATVRYATLLVGISVSRYTYTQPRLLVGLLFFTWVPVTLMILSTIALPLYAGAVVLLGGTIAPSVTTAGSGPQLALLLVVLIVGMIGTLEVEAWAMRRWVSADELLDDLGHWP